MPAAVFPFLVEYFSRDEGVWRTQEESFRATFGSPRQYRLVGGDTFEAAYQRSCDTTRFGSLATRVVDASGNVITQASYNESLYATDNPNHERQSMIKLNIKREGGRLMLYVDAKGLHEILDTIGVPKAGGQYADRPRAAQLIVDRASHTISTEALLRTEYPAKYDLSTVYAEPPSFPSLQRLTESAFEQTRKILEHYQPIDIRVSIQKKDAPK